MVERPQETREERRKARENKKYGKQVQAEKLKERTLKKKESIKSIETWRKQRKQNGFEDDGKAPSGDFNDPDERKGGGAGKNGGRSGTGTPGGRGGDRGASPGGRGGGGQNNFERNKSTPDSMKKKEFKEEKYGNGGRKRVSASNTPHPARGLVSFNLFDCACFFIHSRQFVLSSFGFFPIIHLCFNT